jgi:hypothetical protein
MLSDYWTLITDTHTSVAHRAELEAIAQKHGSDWKRVFLLKSLGFDECVKRGFGGEYQRVILGLVE